MLVKEFLERLPKTPVAVNFMMDLLIILDEFDTEACSVFAGKIRGQLEVDKAKKQELTDLDLVDLCSYADKLDASGHEVYAIQFDERLQELERETGLSVTEIKNKAREYRKNR